MAQLLTMGIGETTRKKDSIPVLLEATIRCADGRYLLNAILGARCTMDGLDSFTYPRSKAFSGK